MVNRYFRASRFPICALSATALAYKDSLTTFQLFGTADPRILEITSGNLGITRQFDLTAVLRLLA